MRASGGQPVSRTGIFIPVREIKASITGLIILTKKSNVINIPMNPIPRVRADLSAVAILILKTSAIIKIITGSRTNG